MTNRFLAFVLAAAALLAACADIDEADVNVVTETGTSETTDPVAVSGAELGAVGAVDEDSGPVVIRADVVVEQGADAAVATADLVDAFFVRLNDGEYRQAGALASAGASTLLTGLETAARCGVEIDAAEIDGPVGNPELVGASVFRLDLPATIRIVGAIPIEVTAIEVKQLGDSSWRISDILLADGMSAAAFMDLDLPSDKQRDIRLWQTDQCLGPDRIEVAYTVENVADEPLILEDLFFRDAQGNRYEVEGGIAQLTAAPVAPESAVVTWQLATEVPNGFDGGQLVLVDIDRDRSLDRGVTVLRERVFTIGHNPLFSDHDPFMFVLESATPEAG